MRITFQIPAELKEELDNVLRNKAGFVPFGAYTDFLIDLLRTRLSK